MDPIEQMPPALRNRWLSFLGMLIGGGLILLFVWDKNRRGVDDNDYEAHIRDLAEDKSEKVALRSFEALNAAGMAAFPALLSSFGDKAPARGNFQRATTGQTNIGEVCFDIVQGQVEGHWPMIARDYHTLTPETAKQWLAAHQGLTLPQLRRAALEESFHRATADLAKDPSAGYLRGTVEFLSGELEKARP